MRRLGGVLGLLQADPEGFLKDTKTVSGLAPEDVEHLITQRDVARTSKNWGESDRIRDWLKAQGVILEDNAGKTTWRRE